MVRRRTSRRKKRSVYQGLGPAPARRGGGWVILVLGALVVVNLYVFVWDKKTGVRAIKQQAEAKGTPAMMIGAQALPAPPAPAPAVAAGSAGSAAPAPARTNVTEGKVGKSDTLGKLLKKSGLTAAEADEIIRALSGTLDFRTIRAGQSFRIERGSDGRVMHFELELAKGKRVHADRQPSGELAAKLES
jgi:hypothetical protein